MLLRYVNAGLNHHSMSLLGLRQAILANDGSVEAHPETVVADTIPSGSTVDTIVAIPPSATPQLTEYALFEAAMHLDNDGALATPGAPNPADTPIAFGGMLTFLDEAGSTGSDPGPVTSAVAATPNPTSGPAGLAPGPVTLSATETASGGANVTAAEYFVDSVGANGTGTAMSGAFGGTTASVTASLSNALLATLSSGNHTLYVHGQDFDRDLGSRLLGGPQRGQDRALHQRNVPIARRNQWNGQRRDPGNRQRHGDGQPERHRRRVLHRSSRNARQRHRHCNRGVRRRRRRRA